MADRHEHTEKMLAADNELNRLQRERREALKRIAAADRKYKAYVKGVGA